MIRESTIEAIRDRMDIMDVVGRFVKLKRNTGLCPFHNEKSGSFHVWKSSQIFKCFGCGESGDAISFVMKHENKTYPEAIEWLAHEYNIVVEFDDETPESVMERQKLGEEREEQLAVMKWAHEKYQRQLLEAPDHSPVKKFCASREIDEHLYKKWNLGFAPNDSHWLHTSIVSMGRFQPGLDCGLIARTEGQNRDFYRNRLLFPVRDLKGNVITFGGRSIPLGDDKIDKARAKFLNGKESVIYNKSKVMYGLYEAVVAKAFKEHGHAYVVEGYMDVIMMHEAELNNTIAPCGTEITDDHFRILKKHTDHIVFAQDGDSAGIKSILKNINRALQLDFKVTVAAFPGSTDPDEYIRTNRVRKPVETIETIEA